MAAARATLALVVLACLLAASAAASIEYSSHDYVSSILSPTTSKPAGYQDGYHDRTMKLRETQLDFCSAFDRYDYSMQSNYECCNDDHEDGGFLSGLGMSLGNCVWSLRFLGYSGPVDISSTLQRIGTVSANCQLNKEIGKCGGPECERLMVNLQGDLYDVIAQAHQDTFNHTIGNGRAESGENCCLLTEFDFQFGEGVCNTLDPTCTAFGTCEDCARCCACDGSDPPEYPDCDLDACCPVCRTSGGKAPANATWSKPAPPRHRHSMRAFRQALKDKRLKGKRATTPAQGSRRNGQQDGTVWVGSAHMGIGTATILSQGGHGHQEIEEVGRWSSVLDWLAFEPLPNADPNLHWVHPGTFELTWTEEEDDAHGYKA